MILHPKILERMPWFLCFSVCCSRGDVRDNSELGDCLQPLLISEWPPAHHHNQVFGPTDMLLGNFLHYLPFRWLHLRRILGTLLDNTHLRHCRTPSKYNILIISGHLLKFSVGISLGRSLFVKSSQRHQY